MSMHSGHTQSIEEIIAGFRSHDLDEIETLSLVELWMYRERKKEADPHSWHPPGTKPC